MMILLTKDDSYKRMVMKIKRDNKHLKLPISKHIFILPHFSFLLFNDNESANRILVFL